MRILIQRVRRASVTIGGALKSAIGPGLLVFVGIEAEDGEEDIEWLAGKLTRLRIFDDENGVMNLDVRQVGGEILVVSQFTLHASTRKGNRPSYIKAAPEAVSYPMYERFAARVAELLAFVRAVCRRCRPCARARSRHRRVRSRYAGRAGERRAGDDLDRLPTTRMTSVISKIVKDERNRAGLHAEIAESDPIRGYVKDIKSSL